MTTQTTSNRMLITALAGAACSWLAVGAAHAAGYESAVLSDAPQAYYRLNESLRTNISANTGSLGASGYATNFNTHPVGGAIEGSGDPAAYYNGTGARTIIPFNAALNPIATQSFTIEAWFCPSVEVTDSPGPAPIMNRYSYSGVNRQGWVYFQRSPTTGWNFRMYSGEGSSTGVDITGQSSTPGAGTAGTWNHVVTVWDGPNSTATMYVNGEQVATGTGTYQANTDDHPASEAVDGPSGLAIGSYNNTGAGQNPFHGAVDEVAFYTNKLTAAQILAHYQSGTNAARVKAYKQLILDDAAVEYLRFSEPSADRDLAINQGSLGVSGDGTNSLGVNHPLPGGLAGSSNSSYGYHAKNNGSGGVPTLIPWNAALNPDASLSFTIESWFQVGVEVTDSPGPAPIMNRYSYSGVNRQGWVYFQRSPTTGWNFRMYSGQGGSTGVDLTGQASTPGAGTAGSWNHVVTVWDGPNSTATMYVNGELVATAAGTYQANTDDHPVEEAVNGASALAIGSYNNTGPGQNPFDGRVDEFAFYDKPLTADQILAHYQAGTNATREKPYQVVVLADQPIEYLRFDEPAFIPAANQGSLGEDATGALIFTTNTLAGPSPTAYPGFETNNTAALFDGSLSFINLGNAAGLNIAGPISLEAWIQPATNQAAIANIITHGTNVALRLVDGTNYFVGSFDDTNHGVTVAIPESDLGTTSWVHLVGLYDGSKWSLFRNGVLAGSATDAVGALATDALWAIGAQGNGTGEVFAGGIDEAAIYNHALTSERIAAHYAAGAASVSAQLTIKLEAGVVKITWVTGTLQSADEVTAAFTNVEGATTPYTPPAGKSATYYRIKY